MREGGCGVVDSSLILDHSTPMEMFMPSIFFSSS